MPTITFNIKLNVMTKIKNSHIQDSDVAINDTVTKVVTVSISPESIGEMATAIASAVMGALNPSR